MGVLLLREQNLVLGAKHALQTFIKRLLITLNRKCFIQNKMHMKQASYNKRSGNQKCIYQKKKKTIN